MTYNATLAELTSLEEMMRQLMEENHIHDDIISKMWQVYSTPYPLIGDVCTLTLLQALTSRCHGINAAVRSSSLVCLLWRSEKS